MTALTKFVDAVDGPVLVLHDAPSAAAADDVRGQGRHVHSLEEPLPDPRRWAGVALLVADRAALRRVSPSLPRLGRARSVACLLTDEGEPIPHLVSRPEWPPITQLRGRRLPSGAVMTVVQFKQPVVAHGVLQELARLTSPVVVRCQQAPRNALDAGVLNPIGFVSVPTQGMATLSSTGTGAVQFSGVPGLTRVDPARGATAAHVAALRPHRGVAVAWEAATPELGRVVSGLAMAGIPLTGAAPPPEVRTILGEALADTFAFDPDLDDPLRREEHSIRQRRAALLLEVDARLPRCSVVLATRRPGQLDFALRQVARQRLVEAELVVAGHGFAPDASRIEAQLPGAPVTVLSLPQSALFGDVLNAAVRASSGDIVVKMDDDDWYGPDFLLDLLLARHYSGADVVGTTAEFVYLDQLNRTVRRHGSAQDASERYATFVAGGTLSVSRELLLSFGGFRSVRRFVDRQLLQAAAAAGVAVYRSHGLGYVLRRTSTGHTWHQDVDFFLDPARLGQQWDGFVPSHLLEPEIVDLPEAATR